MDNHLNKPLVSAVMSVYNAGEFIGEAIDSILNQTYGNFELLILNDASTDNSEQVILEKQKSDSRIKYFINEKNAGLSQTKNKLIPLTTGDYIAITDADDVNKPHRFETQVKFLTEHKNIDILGSSLELINTKGQVCDTWKFPLENSEIKKGMEHATMIANPSAMYKREVFFKIDGYDENISICEDWNFYFRAMENFTFANIPESLVYYRFYETNTSNTKLEDSVLYSIYFKYKLPKESLKYDMVGFVNAYPQYAETACENIIRFYDFSMNSLLKLGYVKASGKLYKHVTGKFFVFFPGLLKRKFLKNTLILYMRNGYIREAILLLKDFFIK